MNFKLRWEELSAAICGNNLLINEVCSHYNCESLKLKF